MIKYEGVENKYLYNAQIVDEIIEMIHSGNYFFEGECTQESVGAVVNAVNSFISSITPVEQKVMLERHETEEEARQYFGAEFIQKFDRLMTILDQQQTMVALHGTPVENCPSICENGLQYKNPSLTATAVLQSMAYGQTDIHYSDYEGLLNWKHRQHKGIVIVAVPYECCYKEGLWRKYQNTDSAAYGGQDYKIDSDFIVGYIDVENKNIVLNPKYNRQHNYGDYLRDNDMFREQNDMDNASFTQLMIAEQQKLASTTATVTVDDDFEQQKIDVSQVPSFVEDMLGMFNSIKKGFPNGMSEERYEYLLGELTNNFKLIQEVLPQLKTNEQVKFEKEEEKRKWAEYCQTLGSNVSDSDWDQWDNVEWEETPEEEQKTGRSL